MITSDLPPVNSQKDIHKLRIDISYPPVIGINRREFSNFSIKSMEPQKNLKTSSGFYPGLEQWIISKKPYTSSETSETGNKMLNNSFKL